MRILAPTLVLSICSAARGRAARSVSEIRILLLGTGSGGPRLLINGTFARSENAIARDRMTDVRVVGPTDAIMSPALDQWHDEENVAVLEFTAGGEGSYTIGISTKPRVLELPASDFNEYLHHDGVLDVLERRRRDGSLERPAAERYSKHVKAIVQVGGQRSDSWTRSLDYPIELIPSQNPYEVSEGDEFEVLLLRGGAPVSGHLIYASHEGFASGGGEKLEAVRARTDDSGRARFPISSTGRWYVRAIHMVESQEDGVDYESNWATLTFEVR